jgi:aspartyl/glutamyl-tRNA(Asn/Gln) amidotransferase C subunit
MEKNEEALKGIDTNGVESTVFVRPLYNVLREDKRVQPFSREDLLKGAPQSTEDSWQVPRLVK